MNIVQKNVTFKTILNWNNFYFPFIKKFSFICCVGHFLFKSMVSVWDPPTFKEFLGLMFLTKFFWTSILLLKKKQRYIKFFCCYSGVCFITLAYREVKWKRHLNVPFFEICVSNFFYWPESDNFGTRWKYLK